MQSTRSRIQVGDKTFRLYLESDEIGAIVARVATEITHDYEHLKDAEDRGPLFQIGRAHV